MKKIKTPPYIRSSNPALAKWQSAVAKVARDIIKKENPNLGRTEINQLVQTHPMVLGTNLHIDEASKEGRQLTKEHIKSYLPSSAQKLDFHPVVHSFLSQEFYKNVNKPKTSVDLLGLDGPIEFPDSDYAYIQWANCVRIWGEYGNPSPSPYVDIDKNGGPSSDFGVFTIPENSKIVILGDFGTGLNDATTMLIAIMQQIKPDFIIHLGDIYYAGTEDECESYVETFDKAFAAAGKKIPVFSIPGNHEYYAGGWGFYKSVITMNQKNGFSNYNQQSSYFSLQTQDKNWQFLGMDTGYNSIHNFNIAHPSQLGISYSPWLTFNEAAWHQNKLENFDGKSILLSHHQLFSSDSLINNSEGVYYKTGTNKSKLEYLNGNLLAVFQPYFRKVAAWFWGHEHTLNIFKENQLNLAKARLIGNSGYEEWAGEDPYKPTNSPYQDLTPAVEVGTTSVEWKNSNYDFLNHGFACIQLNGSDASVDYFQYPVFAPSDPIPANPPQIMKVNYSDPCL